jgi:hypothetical protein
MAKPKQPAGSRPKASGPKASRPRAGAPGTAPARTRGTAAGAPRAPARGPRGAVPAPAVAAQPVPLPRSVQIAVWLMYAGAALAALDLIATLATSGSVRAELHRANPSWTTAQLTTGVHSFITSIVVSWAITIAVWLIRARTNSAGRAWARNVATVLSALSTLSFILYLHEPGSLLGKLLLVPMWLVGVAAAALLWRRDSTAYIRAGQAA